MIAFRTSNDEQVQKFIDWHGEWRMWSDVAHALAKEATGDDRFLSYGPGRFTAFLWESPDEPPAGLRRAKNRDGGIVPDKRVKAGREWQRRIDELPKLTKTARCDGVPKGIVVHARRGSGLLVHDVQYHRFQNTGPLYVVWNCDCAAEQQESIVDQVDASIWEQVKLSEFYAEIEAELAAAKTD